MQGELRLADRLAHWLRTRAPHEWQDYQDWLHDILLARRQLLQAGRAPWQVSLLTTWRLTTFCVTVGIITLRRWTQTLRSRL